MISYDRYDAYDDSHKFAVRLHRGYLHAPDGWPATVNPFARGKDELTAEEKAAGFVVMTKKHLNDLRQALAPRWQSVDSAVESHELSVAKQNALEQHDAMAASIQSILDGSAREKIKKAESLADLLHVRSQIEAISHKGRI